MILDATVIPPGGKVIDYRTRSSGMTAKIIEEKGIDFNEAQGKSFTFFMRF